MSRTVYVEKNFKQVKCGTIETYKDDNGNTKFHVDRTVDKQQFQFYSIGAAELWLKLGGLLHG